jgi:hypothetical protein
MTSSFKAFSRDPDYAKPPGPASRTYGASPAMDLLAAPVV